MREREREKSLVSGANGEPNGGGGRGGWWSRRFRM